ncbi:MAG: response regulator transcription factor [Lachnospiraceae bacterium]|nr:response regulator transcription factor [Lachnospiraceae bacterium]
MDKILVIEDDEIIKNELCTLLQSNGYKTVESLPCDLALLDINLPGDSGYEICRKLRLKSDIPVIFLTARDSAEDELIAFGVGADDFIRKPYNSSVLLARISRLLKRKNNTLKQVRGLTLNLEDMTVAFGENYTELTKNETRILACLMNKDLCSKEEIIEDLWSNNMYVDENTLYVNINRLRGKLSRLGAGGFIRTVRGVGYRL